MTASYDTPRTLKEKPGPPADGAAVIERDPEEEAGRGGGSSIKCSACRSKVTEASARAEIDGRHRHTFFNPHGLVFDIGCFSRAAGCAPVSPPTTEFTWFPGYAWRIVVCRSCGVHLGWSYHSESGGGTFFGLILDLLVEEDDEQAD